MLGDIVKSCFEKAQGQQKSEGYIKLERGFATIPLSGIDVPFHSRYLWSGVMPFRACEFLLCFCSLSALNTATDLSKKIPADLLDPSLLEDVYIPNLVASPFAVNKD